MLDVRAFGALGDGTTDDHASFVAALQAAKNTAGALVIVPAGAYRLGQPLVVDGPVILQGEGAPSGSRLLFADDQGEPSTAAGIVISFPDGQRSELRDVSIETGSGTYYRSGPEPPIADDDVISTTSTASGVVIEAPARLSNCHVTGFQHDGVHINTSVDAGRNANSWRLTNCLLGWNGRHGLFVSGGNTNAGVALGLECVGNHSWAIFDQSYLGNLYLGCMAEANGDKTSGRGGAFMSEMGTAANVFVGCYAESDQAYSLLRHPALVVGGIEGALVRELAGAESLALLRSGGRFRANALHVTALTAAIRRIDAFGPIADQYIYVHADHVILANAIGGVVPLVLPSVPAHPVPLDHPGTDPTIPAASPTGTDLPQQDLTAGGDVREVVSGWENLSGLQLRIKKIDTSSNAVTITVGDAAAGDRIDGQTAVELREAYAAVHLVAEVWAAADKTPAHILWHVV